MFESLEIMRMANALARHSGSRLGLVAENIANADTPGYRSRDLKDFSAVWSEEGMAMKATRPGHLTAAPSSADPQWVLRDGPASPDGNTVSLQGEMLSAAETRQDHDMALAIYKNAADILRAAIGRK